MGRGPHPSCERIEGVEAHAERAEQGQQLGLDAPREGVVHALVHGRLHPAVGRHDLADPLHLGYRVVGEPEPTEAAALELALHLVRVRVRVRDRDRVRVRVRVTLTLTLTLTLTRCSASLSAAASDGSGSRTTR